MWYCVVDVKSFRVLYHGENHASARGATTADTYCARAATRGEAEIKAAMAAGYVQRGQPVPDKYKSHSFVALRALDASRMGTAE